MVEMHYVQSSNVECVGYDSAVMELHVRYLSSPTTYVYLNVPQQVFDDVMMASSKGTYISQCVKNVYPFERR